MLKHSLPESRRRAARAAYTLVEILIATVLTLMMMGAVAQLFEAVGKGITGSRALLEVSDRYRMAAARLQQDLDGVKSLSPLQSSLVNGRIPSPSDNAGYFEYTEGPVGPVVRPEALFVNGDTNAKDTSVIDNDDVLMCTVHAQQPFSGRYAQPIRRRADRVITGYDYVTIQSFDAEIAWFVRGRTLYRRVLLIVPGLDLGDNLLDSGVRNPLTGYFAYNDISMHVARDANNNPVPLANTLGDLTKPENRYAHRPFHMFGGAPVYDRFPFHPHSGAAFGYFISPPVTLRSSPTAPDGSSPDNDPLPVLVPTAPAVPGLLTDTARSWRALGLPTQRESSYMYAADLTKNWPAGGTLPNLGKLTPLAAGGGSNAFDLWTNPRYWSQADRDTGDAVLADTPALTIPRYLGERINEDVILSHVIGFDVKAWDPGAPIIGVNDTSGATPVQIAVLMPGDAGYLYGLANNGATINNRAYYIASRGAYVDLNYLCGLGPMSTYPDGTALPALPEVYFRPPHAWPDCLLPPTISPSSLAPSFHWTGHWRSGMRGVDPFIKANLQDPFDTTIGGGGNLIDSATNWIADAYNRDSVYDTWSTHYEADGIAQFPNTTGNMDGYTNGSDDRVYNPNYLDPADPRPSGYYLSNFTKRYGGTDDGGEKDTQPPYPAGQGQGVDLMPLHSIQVTIRVYEPGTNQILQRTIRQSF